MTHRSLLTAAFFIISINFVIAENRPLREATLSPLKAPPVIDGVISEGEWEGAVGTAGFQNIVRYKGMFMDARTGRTRVGFTKDRLYLLIESEIPPTGIIARDLPRDSDLIWDDGIEIWLDPNRDHRDSSGGDESFYQIIVNALGSIEDKRFDPALGAPDSSWNGNWEFANGIDQENHKWVAELSIPFKDLGWDDKVIGRSIGVLVSRNYKKPWNQATWFPHDGAFSNWYEYPRLHLTEDAPSVIVQSLGDGIFDGVLELEASVYNPGAARTVEVELDVVSTTMPELANRKTLELPAESSVDYTFQVPKDRLHDHAAHDLNLVVREEGASAANFAWALKWTNVEAAMSPVGSGRKWDVRDGPDPDAAIQVAHYPSYQLLKVRIEPAALDREDLEIQSATFQLLGPDGELMKEGAMNWAGGIGEDTFAIPALPEGDSRLIVRLDGIDEDFERTIIRRIYPWEGNQLGITDKVYPPFTPVEVDGEIVSVVLRDYESGGLGLWSSIKAQGNVSAGGPHELLAAPIRLLANGKAVDGSGGFTDSNAQEAVYEGSANVAGARISTVAVTEYDGCQRFEITLAPGEDETKLESLVLEIPLRDELMPLWHCSTTSLRTNPVGATPAGEGDIWDSRQFPDGEWYGNFKPYLWLGGEELGLSWFADNDKGWVLDVDESDPAASAPSLALHRKDGVLTLRVMLVQKPVLLKEPRTITFGLMASPAKPLPDDWRSITFGKRPGDQRIIHWMGAQYWGSDTQFAAKYPRNKDLSILDRVKDARTGVAFDEKIFLKEYEVRNFNEDQPLYNKTPEQIMQLAEVTLNWAKEAQGKRFLTNAYWDEFHSTLRIHEEVDTFGSEWSGRYGYGSVRGIVPSHQDFAIWWGAEFIRRGIGLYFDNAFPMRSYDTITTTAYELPNGRIQPSAGIWARRDYLKRIWVLHHTESNPETPVMQMIHMTNTHILPYMVWNESNLDLEWFYGPEPQQSKYGHALLRAQSLGRQTGNIPLALAVIDNVGSPEQRTAIERTRFGTMMVHEIKVRMDGSDGELLELVREFGYGSDDCAVTNYWDAAAPITTSNDEEVKWLLLTRDDAQMLVLCSWNREAETVKITWDDDKSAFKPTRVVCAESEMVESFDPDSLTLTVPMDAYGVRVLKIQ